MPSPKHLPPAAGECGQQWTCHSSKRASGRLYVHNKVTKHSYWVDEVCGGYQCYMKYLANAPPEQKAGGSGDETGSLQALCHEKYAAADAAPVPPLRRQCRDGYGCCNPPDNAAANAALLWICKDYANGFCKRGPNCPLRHDKTEAAQLRDVPPPPGVCRYFFRDGICDYGTRCKYPHVTPSDAKFDADAETQQRYCRRRQDYHLRHKTTEAAHVRDLPLGVCHSLIRRGYCYHGNRCKYRHETLSDAE